MFSRQAPAIVESVSCNGCGKLISTKDVKKYGLGNLADGYQCFECLTAFQLAREALHEELSVKAAAVELPAITCIECRKTLDQLVFEERARADKENRPVRHLPWYTQMKDGKWVSMCESCSDGYVRKQNDLYRGTKFEHDAKLRGSK